MKFVKVIVSLILVTSVFAQERARLPLVVVIEKDPWRWIIGSDSPSFVLYTDGLVVYRRHDLGVVKKEEYFCQQFNQVSTDSLVKLLDYRSLDSLKEYYEASRLTDQPTNLILYNVGDGLRIVTIYGNLSGDSLARIATPQSVIALYDKVSRFRETLGTEWLPEKIEIMIQPMKSTEKPVSWPKGWPDINSRDTRGNEQLCSIYLNREQFEEFVKLNRTRKQGQAFLINGKKWHASYRIPFPEEDIWMQ
jgi:hypothetical protein